MKQEHKSYNENYKKTIVNLYELGKNQIWQENTAYLIQILTIRSKNMKLLLPQLKSFSLLIKWYSIFYTKYFLNNCAKDFTIL